MPLSSAFRMQVNSDDIIVFRPEWQRIDFVQYKVIGARISDPDILMLGSSRTLNFTSDMFVDDSFYNAGVVGSSIYAHRPMLQTLVESGQIPDVVLLGIDFMEYNAAKPADSYATYSPSTYLFEGFRRTFNYWLAGDMPDLMTHSRTGDGFVWLGRTAIDAQDGYLVDGRWYRPSYVHDLEGYLTLADGYYQREDADQYYIRGTDVDTDTIAELTAFLAIAHEYDITVIGFTQPYYPLFADRLRDNPEFTYRDLALLDITALFTSYNFPLYTFPDIESYDGNADEFFDDWHYSELASVRMLTDMTEGSPEILGDYVDLDQLYDDIATAPNPLYIY
ncbi:MAG: hypothetical protein AAFQ07_18970, partial [Chloroflexota bacterium]